MASKKSKKLSNPFSTGGRGEHFEAHIQASFVTLMLTGGYAPCLPCWPITEIKLQGKIDGFNTDDLIVFVERPDTKEQRKLLGQIKSSVSVTQSSDKFSDFIQGAWNDFNNPDIFIKGKDIITLITGPLNATDSRNVQWLLDEAKHTKSVDEFFRNVERTNFSPPKSVEKLAVIRHHLKAANNNIDISRDDLYSFLNHFYLLGYDLGNEVGVILSLLHSHISQFNRQNPEWIWSRVVDTVQTWNQYAGTITLDRLPEDLLEAFKQPTIAQIPKVLTVPKIETAQIDWNQHQYFTDLALANLVGSWNENNASDIEILQKLIGEKYSSWVLKARGILHLQDSPLSLKNGVWKITERVSLWDALGSHIFDQNLETFKDAVITVLTEHSPSFELPTHERYAANIRGKVLTYSPDLRKGLAEGLAILGNKPEALINCSQNKPEITAVLTIREIFAKADWVLWGSLNDLLPILAEAAPEEFLSRVEKALSLSPGPFNELFSQEGSGITGRNYLTGLLWALEGLAWDEKYLVRVYVILGELASHDPGGNWANRPENSLSTILLPWLPQTIAPIEKRKVAVQTLCQEWPEIGWKLIISLLPNQNQVSTGSYKPFWHNPIPDDWENVVTRQEYWDQVSFYAELAISIADHDFAKLAELIGHFDNLPKTSFDKLIDILSSETISSTPEDQRLLLWDRLRDFTAQHRRFSDATWALNDDLLSAIEAIADKLAPSHPLNLYQHLFSDNDFNLYEENGNWKEQEKKLKERRQNAVKEILQVSGIDELIKFASEVESPRQVGHSLGRIANATIDSVLLPEHLESDNHKLLTFISTYIWSRRHTNSWQWVDELDKTNWSNNQLVQLLSFLPFTNETWERVAHLSNEVQSEYWSKTNANPYQTNDELEIAIDRLLEHERPHAAIDCLDRMRHANKPINAAQSIRALLAALSSSEPTSTIDRYQVVELIKFLQESSDVSSDDLLRIEWAYLPLLDGRQEASPKLLETHLANDPEFFCEVIRIVYRSKKENTFNNEPSEDLKAIAMNAGRLLHEWKTPPGTKDDNSFDDTQFAHWLNRVIEICNETGHLEVALITIGGVLIYCPPDEDGLWINRTVAKALNHRDASDMRDGFSIGISNSRGVHWVDPTGKPERELAEKFRQRAEDVENAGFQRLTVTLRGLADSYDREAKRIIAEHKKESEEDQGK